MELDSMSRSSSLAERAREQIRLRKNGKTNDIYFWYSSLTAIAYTTLSNSIICCWMHPVKTKSEVRRKQR